jgi:hypothetical protein
MRDGQRDDARTRRYCQTSPHRILPRSIDERYVMRAG